jgi:hypothetical protein
LNGYDNLCVSKYPSILAQFPALTSQKVALGLMTDWSHYPLEFNSLGNETVSMCAEDAQKRINLGNLVIHRIKINPDDSQPVFLPLA